MRYNPQIVTAWFAEHGIKPETEWKFCETRRWRFDFAWPDQKVALECEGGVWTGGRHSRGKGMIADMHKYNTATVLGWRVLRTTPSELCMQETVDMVKAVLKLA